MRKCLKIAIKAAPQSKLSGSTLTETPGGSERSLATKSGSGQA